MSDHRLTYLAGLNYEVLNVLRDALGYVKYAQTELGESEWAKMVLERGQEVLEKDKTYFEEVGRLALLDYAEENQKIDRILAHYSEVAE